MGNRNTVEPMPSQLTWQPYNPSGVRRKTPWKPRNESYHDNKGAFSITYSRDYRGNLCRKVTNYQSRRDMKHITGL